MDRREFIGAGIAGIAGVGVAGAFGASSALGAVSAPEAREIRREAEVGQLELFYNRPAGQWLEALPIGNGRIGAMVHGRTDHEILQLNESSVWQGSPHNYDSPDGLEALPEIRRLVFAEKWHEAQDLVNRSFLGRPGGQAMYQTVGNLEVRFDHDASFLDYIRRLDIDQAVSTIEYTVGDTRFTREVFASAPDQVIVARFSASRGRKLSFHVTLTSPQNSQISTSGGNTVVLNGTSGNSSGAPGRVKFQVLARVQVEGGALQAATDSVSVSEADHATVILSIGSSHRNYKDCDGDPAQIAAGHLDAATAKSYAALKKAHIADYQRLFHRFSIYLGGSDLGRAEADRPGIRSADLQPGEFVAATATAAAAASPLAKRPTDERIRTFSSDHDPSLAALYCQYGRYLLLSCSRPGGQPATLQGLWNDSLNPPWGSKYTININTEMNYWLAGPGNLLECYDPLFDMLGDLAASGARTAADLYGSQGWMCHHNTDLWRGAAPVDGAFWGMWPSGGAWLCKSIWDRYTYTGDIKTLGAHYPILKGASVFFLHALVEDPDSKALVTCPSVSPENGHHDGVSICAGPTMDMQIVRDLFESVVRASELLKVDSDLRAQLSAARERLAPMRVGAQGQLQEWQKDWDAGAPEQQHRHVSHLYGLHPSEQITKRATPQLFDAARKSLITRGDESTGWAMAWRINLWARLEDGNHAYRLVSGLLTPDRTAPNMFDLHPPFQIDGNFGGAAGIIEMLVQSHSGEMHLLPALPDVWPSGRVRGIVARGGYDVDLEWAGGKLKSATIHRRNGAPQGPCRIRIGENVQTLEIEPGKSVTVGPA